MTDLHQKLLERVKYVTITSECDGCGLQSTEAFEDPRIPIISRLIRMNEELVNALEHFKRIGDMGYEDVVLCFAEDPSNIDYAKDALTANQAQMEKLAGEN